MNSEFLPDRWATRDFPVLREAARIIDDDTNFAGARIQEVATSTGLEVEHVLLAAKALQTAGLVELRLLMPARAGRIVAISAEARRMVGLWPTPESGLDRMIGALEAIASNTDATDDDRTFARRTLDGLKGGARHVGLAMATAYATGQIPGH